MGARGGNPRQRQSLALGHVAKMTARYPIPWTLTQKNYRHASRSAHIPAPGRSVVYWEIRIPYPVPDRPSK